MFFFSAERWGCCHHSLWNPFNVRVVHFACTMPQLASCGFVQCTSEMNGFLKAWAWKQIIMLRSCFWMGVGCPVEWSSIKEKKVLGFVWFSVWFSRIIKKRTEWNLTVNSLSGVLVGVMDLKVYKDLVSSGNVLLDFPRISRTTCKRQSHGSGEELSPIGGISITAFKIRQKPSWLFGWAGVKCDGDVNCFSKSVCSTCWGVWRLVGNFRRNSQH